MLVTAGTIICDEALPISRGPFMPIRSGRMRTHTRGCAGDGSVIAFIGRQLSPG
jgi:CRP-like cAMP-binding protein